MPVTPVQFYQLVNRLSGLSVAPQQDIDGSQLIQANPGDPIQPQFLWGFIQVGIGKYRIFNYFSGLCVDVGGGSTPINGEAVQQYHWKPDIGNQQWYLNGDDTNGYFFESALDRNFVWDVAESSRDPGAGLVVNAKTGGQDQQWKADPRSAVLVSAAQSGAD